MPNTFTAKAAFVTASPALVRRRACTIWLTCTLTILAAAQASHAQSGILGTNLIVNGDAEQGPAGTSVSDVVTSIPGWTRTAGNVNVLPYSLTYLTGADPAPQDHGFNYFAAGPVAGSSSITQNIDVSSVASTISAGNVRYTASAYLGSALGSGLAPPTEMDVAFKNANGQTFTPVPVVGPLGYNGDGISLQQVIGLVPAGTVTIAVTLTLVGNCENAAECGYAAADDLSLVLTTLGTTPGLVLGTNLIANPGAEAGPGVPPTSTTAYIPGWSTAHGASVAPYGGTGWISTTDPGPVNRGVNLFCGGQSGANIYQDIDVSAAGSLIDANQVTYNISAWLGGLAGASTPTLTYTFYDWSGNQLAATATLGPANHAGTGLVETTSTGNLPQKTRRIHILLTFPSDITVADNIVFTLAAPSGPPVIPPGGIVSASAFGEFPSIAPGSWIEIYGTDLASTPQTWTLANFTNGVAPTSLGSVTGVSIGGMPAFVDYVSPSQINALVPSNAPTGAQPLTITNGNGTSDTYWINVNQTEPGLLAPANFVINGKQYVAALFPDNVTFALPAGAIPGVTSRPAKSGDTLTLYGVGFGQVTPNFPAGTVVTEQNTLTTSLQFLIGTASATPAYDGLAPSYTGLYQFNVVVPAVGADAAMPLSIDFGGAKGVQTLYIATQN
jgi:uncharacterized protein (TIGR03437 family)